MRTYMRHALGLRSLRTAPVVEFEYEHGLKTAISCSIVKTQQNRQNSNPYTFEASIIACLSVRVWNLLEPEPNGLL